jgi:type II secretory pathway pseudopilin PulG
MNKQRFTQAFSVTELIVVIAIIGFLVVASVGSYDVYRTEARDTQRIATLGQIHLALKQYASVYGDVPNCADSGYPGGCDLSSFGSYSGACDTTLDSQFLEVLVTAGYLPEDIIDPLNDGAHFYAYGANGEFPPSSGNYYDIFLITLLEDDTNPILDEDINELPGVENAYIIADNI